MNCSVGYLYICLVFTIFTVIQQTQGKLILLLNTNFVSECDFMVDAKHGQMKLAR